MFFLRSCTKIKLHLHPALKAGDQKMGNYSCISWKRTEFKHLRLWYLHISLQTCAQIQSLNGSLPSAHKAPHLSQRSSGVQTKTKARRSRRGPMFTLLFCQQFKKRVFAAGCKRSTSREHKRSVAARSGAQPLPVWKPSTEPCATAGRVCRASANKMIFS